MSVRCLQLIGYSPPFNQPNLVCLEKENNHRPLTVILDHYALIIGVLMCFQFRSSQCTLSQTDIQGPRGVN